MIQNMTDLMLQNTMEELQDFVNYLGIDYEDYLELINKEVDFDDCSR